jgi:hypothetical protein
MKPENKIKLTIIGSVLFFYMNSASALGQLSRACQFYTIPSELKPIAAAFFYALGADADVLTLPAQSAQVQATKWVLESLTTDYGRVRYLLFATRIVYGGTGVNLDTGLLNYTRQRYLDMSSQWTSEQISDAMKADPKFSYYYLNRGILASARAGNPKIVDTMPYTEPTAIDALAYLVVGYHWYYDPVGKQVVRLADSQANTCNLRNMGLGTGLFDR